MSEKPGKQYILKVLMAGPGIPSKIPEPERFPAKEISVEKDRDNRPPDSE